MITRLGVSGFTRPPYGSFAGKAATEEAAAVTGFGNINFGVDERELERRRVRARKERRALKREIRALLAPEKAAESVRPAATTRRHPTRATVDTAELEALTALAVEAGLLRAEVAEYFESLRWEYRRREEEAFVAILGMVA